MFLFNRAIFLNFGYVDCYMLYCLFSGISFFYTCYLIVYKYSKLFLVLIIIFRLLSLLILY